MWMPKNTDAAVRQQAITRANVDPTYVAIWRHFATMS